MDKRVKVSCFICHKKFRKPKSKVTKHNFCSYKCFCKWNSKRFYKFNKSNNPINQTGKVPLDVRLKKRESMLKHRKEMPHKYLVYMGKALHRVLAEKKLHRKLKPNEIVHHKDGNIHNNRLSNLMVLKSRAEHARIHARLRRRQKNAKH